ncbi:MAG: hypothetical protein K5665_00485 [Saccharofermentans sp.]|nr:hypothetical protein [Saccharofermentans sp.]
MMIIIRRRWLSATILPIVLFYLFEFRFFYLIPLPTVLVAGTTNKNLLAVFSLVAILYFLLRTKKISFGYFGYTFSLIFITIAASTLLSSFEFGFKTTQVLWGIIPYLILLLYFPGKKYLSDEDIREQFIVIGELCTLLIAALFLFQYVQYKNHHTLFLNLPNMIPDHYYWHPEDGLRIRNTFDGFFRVFSLIIADRIFAKKFKKCTLDVFSLISMLLVILIIDRSRSYLVIVMLSAIAMLIYRAKRKTTKALFLLGSVTLIAGVAVISNKLSSIFSSISDNTGSWFARVEGVVHFTKIGLEHFFLGIGMADPEAIASVEKYVRGPEGIFYADDVGIVGVFALTGVIGLVLYLLFIAKVFKCFRNADRNKALLFGLFICLILSSVLSSYFDRSRITALVLTAVFCEINCSKRPKVHELDYIDRL